MSTINLGEHVIGESRRNGVWTVARAKRILDSDRVRQNGDIGKLYKAAKYVLRSDVGDWVRQRISEQQLHVEVLDYYQDVRDDRVKTSPNGGTTVIGVTNRLRNARE